MWVQQREHVLSVSVWRQTKRLYSLAFFASVVSRDWVGTQSAAMVILKGSMHYMRTVEILKMSD